MSARADNLLSCDGIVRLHEDALAAADARRLFEELMAVTPWRHEIATVMGRRVPIPRLTAWHGAAGYVYSGIRMTPAPWNQPLLEIKAVAEACAGQAFNSVLLNLYRDGRDSVSWHADNEPGLGRNPVIASISLGATRRFQMKHRQRDRAPFARPASGLVPGHGRGHAASLAASGAEDQPPGRRAHQSDISGDGRGVSAGAVVTAASRLPGGRASH